MRTSTDGGFGDDDLRRLFKLIALGFGMASLYHLAKTGQPRGWHAVGVVVGVLGGLADF